MSFKSFLSIGKEKESLNKLIELLRSPSSFFGNNQDTKEQLLDFMTFVVRIAFIVLVVTRLIGSEYISIGYLIFSLAFLVLSLLLARIIAIIGLAIGSYILNFFARIILRKTDLDAAKRIIAYCSVFSLFPRTLVFELIVFPLALVFIVIGISKQYKVSYPKAIIVVVAEVVFFWIFFTALMNYLLVISFRSFPMFM